MRDLGVSLTSEPARELPGLCLSQSCALCPSRKPRATLPPQVPDCWRHWRALPLHSQPVPRQVSMRGCGTSKERPPDLSSRRGVQACHRGHCGFGPQRTGWTSRLGVRRGKGSESGRDQPEAGSGGWGFRDQETPGFEGPSRVPSPTVLAPANGVPRGVKCMGALQICIDSSLQFCFLRFQLPMINRDLKILNGKFQK